jgi:hypothetical protein
MQPRRSERLPPQGDVYRVVREYGLLVIITLIESDAPAFSEVYSWNYFYVTLPPCIPFWVFEFVEFIELLEFIFLSWIGKPIPL